MMNLRRVIFLGTFIVATSAMGAITISGASGVTGYKAAATTNDSFSLYGAKVGTCNSPSTSATCDTCRDQAGRLSCSFNAINPSLIITISGTTNTAGLFGAPTNSVTLKNASSSAISGVTSSAVSSSGAFQASIVWANLCLGIGTNDGTCSTDTRENITLTITNGTTTESATIAVVLRSSTPLSTIDTYTDCSSPTSNTYGFCHMTVSPGDTKVYLDNLKAPTVFPTSPSSKGINYTKLVVFGKATSSPNNVTSADEAFYFAVTSSSSPYISETRYDSLNNDTQYCFIFATQDEAGLVSYFTPTGTTSGLCATPSKVFGLLDGKKCFIATAAWGSEMDQHVQIFRDFRDRFLMTNSLGRSFVNWYYSWSPNAAATIRESETLRVGVRALLWPVLNFAEASLRWGLYFFAGVLFALIACFTALLYYAKHRNLERKLAFQALGKDARALLEDHEN